MGLDVSHDCWRGAYSAFTRWRNELSTVAGYGVAVPDGGFFELPAIDWEDIQSGRHGDTLNGDWKQTPSDPLLILLAHYDCEGHILARDCAPLADRLAELLPLLPNEEASGHIGHWHTKTQAFIDGLRMAAERGEVVEFA